MAINWEQVARLLEHELVVEILVRCDRERRSPREMSDEIGVPIGRLAYHVRRLTDLGLLELVHVEQRRGALEHYYLTCNVVRKTPRRVARSGSNGSRAQVDTQHAVQGA